MAILAAIIASFIILQIAAKALGWFWRLLVGLGSLAMYVGGLGIDPQTLVYEAMAIIGLFIAYLLWKVIQGLWGINDKLKKLAVLAVVIYVVLTIPPMANFYLPTQWQDLTETVADIIPDVPEINVVEIASGFIEGQMTDFTGFFNGLVAEAQN